MLLVEPCCTQKHLLALRNKLGDGGTAFFHGYGDVSLSELLPSLLVRYSEADMVIVAPSIPDGAAETISYVPIQDTGWKVAVLIRESVIQDQIREISDKTLAISRNQIGFTLISMLVFAGVLLLQLTVLSKEKIEAEKENSRAFQNMANTDSLTGVRNKHAYTESEAVLNQMIRENRLQELAVVVCDINGLKHVNDTLGHAAGDKLIKDACAMICEYSFSSRAQAMIP